MSHTADTSAFGRRTVSSNCSVSWLIQPGRHSWRLQLPTRTRGTHCIDPGGMKGWVNPDRDLNPRPRSRESDPYWDRTPDPAIPSPTRLSKYLLFASYFKLYLPELTGSIVYIQEAMWDNSDIFFDKAALHRLSKSLFQDIIYLLIVKVQSIF